MGGISLKSLEATHKPPCVVDYLVLVLLGKFVNIFAIYTFTF